jgi:hypothetical protein
MKWFVEEWNEMLTQSWAQSLSENWKLAVGIAVVVTTAVVIMAFFPKNDQPK